MAQKEAKKEVKIRGVFERSKGSGVYWICYFDREGRKHREKVGTKSQARDRYEQRKTEIRQEKFDPEMASRKRKTILVSEVVKVYLAYSRANKRSWFEDDRHGRYVKDAFGEMTLQELRPKDIEAWMTERLKTVKPATVNRTLAFLKHLYTRAIRDGQVDRNPVSAIKLLQENNKRVRFLLDEEEDSLRQSMTPEEFAIVEIAFKTGMREAEQFTLQWPQIDFRNRIITIPRSKHGETRHIDIGDDVAALLRGLPTRMKGPWVFPAEILAPRQHNIGNPKSDPRAVQEDAGQNWVRRVFDKATRKADIHGLTWHGLRHTFASRLVMAGVDLPTVQILMGHKSITMTMRYAHLSPGHRRDAVQRLNRLPIPVMTAANGR